MNHSRPQLGYASTGSAPPSRGRRRLIVAACCFGVSWLVWLVVAIATFDSFDDEWFTWMFLVAVIPGTASGVVMFAIVNVVVELCGRD